MSQTRDPLRNRVDPWGKLHAISSRGTLMGNRGILHNENLEIVRPWQHTSWVTCLLCLGDIRRNVFSPGRYSELFFLDEATALAAGHRPCGTCQRDRHALFKSYWGQMHPPASGSLLVSAIDKQLHSERQIRGGHKKTFTANVNELPVGTLFEYSGQAVLASRRGLLAWSFQGYAKKNLDIPASSLVQVLTPPTVVGMFRLGFEPRLHASAD